MTVNSVRGYYFNKIASQSYHLIALEPRMMFDAAAVATASDALAATIAQDQANDAVAAFKHNHEAGRQVDIAVAPFSMNGVQGNHGYSKEADYSFGAVRPVALWEGWDRTDIDTLASARNFAAHETVRFSEDNQAIADLGQSTGNSVIFIDTSVANYQQLASQWADRGTVILIDTKSDGINQMRIALAGMRNLGSIHIVSHGSDGAFYLGTTVVNAAAINGELRGSFEAIGRSLNIDGDILIYGCSFAASDAGRDALRALASASNADVAASSDNTGAAALGGDWDLEARSGIVLSMALDGGQWNGLLLAPKFYNTPDLVTNGSFENGTSPWTAHIGAVESGSASTYGTPTAPDGEKVVEVEGARGSTYIEQTITTVVGQSYIYSVQGTTRRGANVGERGILSVNGNNILSFTTDNTWKIYSATFVATSTSTTIRITSDGSDGGGNPEPNDGSGLIIDDAHVYGVTPYVTTFTEGGSAVNAVSQNTRLLDQDSANATSVTIRITNGKVGDVLALSGAATNGISVVYNPTTFTMTLTSSGSNPRADFDTILKDIKFSNTTESPDTTQRNISIVANDGTANSVPLISTINVIAVNDAPTLADTVVTLSNIVEDVLIGAALPGTGAGTAISALTGGISDVDASPVKGLAITGIDTSNGIWYYTTDNGTTWIQIPSASTANALLLSASSNNNRIFFKPNPDYNGTVANGITFRAWDTTSGTNGGTADTTVNGGSTAFSTATDTASITVTPVADIVADNITTNKNTAITFNAITGIGGGSADNFENAGRVITSVTQPSIGAVTFLANGSITYTPPANFVGTTSFTYTVTSGGATETATVTVTVAPGNDPPTSVGTIANQTSVDAQSGISVATAANFADPDVGDTRTYSATGLPAGLSINASTGVISGTIDRSASQGGAGGVYSIAVKMTDSAGAFATQSFTWTVTNPPPTAVNDTATTPEDTLVNIAVLTNDSDPDGDPLTITAASSPNGTVVIRANGTLDFTPAANFNGPTTISYTISDGQGGITSATVTVNVTAVNDPPTSVGTIANQTSVDAQSGISVATAANFADPDVGDTRTYSATGLPAGLSINASTGVISGTIDRSASQGGTNGVHNIAVKMTDSAGASATQSFTWTVTNPPPTAVNDTATTPEDTLVNIAVLTNDSDPDGDPLTITAASSPNGTVVIRANGTLDFTPAANFNGPATISYTISDGQGGITSATVTVNVTAVNDPPTSVGTIANQTSVDAQSGISVATAANFADPDVGDTRTYSATGLPAGLSINTATGVISGTIDRSASQGGAGGVYSIAVKMTDSAGASATQNFTWTVTNPPPTAVNDSATTPEDTLVNIAVLTNDSDPDGDPLTITAASSPNGTVVIRANGTLDFTPAANFNGPTTISYTISDGQGGITSATVTVNVTAVNDPPTSVGTIANQTSVDAQSGISVATAANFGDVDAGDTRTYSATGLPAGLSINASTGVISGTIDRSASQGGAAGVYSIAVRMTDSAGAFATQSFTWTVTNPPPTAVNDSATTLEDTLVNIAVLTNDSDPDGDPLTITAASSPNGTVVIRANGTLDFTPAANFNGPATISYTISDGQGGTSTGTVNVNVTAVNDPPTSVGAIANQTSVDAQSGISVATAANFADPDVGDTRTYSATGLPAGLTINASTGVISGTIDRSASQGGVGGVYSIAVRMTDGAGAFATQSFTWTVTNPPPTAVNDSATTPEDTLVNIAVLTNDSDPDGDPLTITAASSPNGTVVIRANGTLDFTPAANFNGPATISYTISDGQGGITSATVNVNVTAVNDPPTTTGLPAQFHRDGISVTVPLSSHFSDIDGGALTYTATGLPPGLSINPTTGVVTGTLPANASGPTGTMSFNVTVTANDGNGGTVQTSFVWTIKNTAPVAVNDSATTPEDTPVTVTVLTNDSDPDGDPITIVPGSIVTSEGAAVLNANGTITYTPSTNFNGTTLITYTISDGQNGFATGTVTVTVAPVNDAPTSTAIPNMSSVDAQTGTALDTSDFFKDVDGDTLSYTATNLPLGLSINAATGVISGTIDRSASQGGATGVYTVTVTGRDPGGLTSSQSFTWTVTNPPPTAVNDTATTPEDTLVNIAVLTNDSDPDGDPLTITAASSPNGTVVIRANGTLDFTPAANFNGPATISYTISDGQGGTSTGTVNVNVTAVNDPPTSVGAIANQTSVDAQSGISVATAANFADPDVGDTRTYSATGLPAGLTINASTGVISGTIDRSASQGGVGGVYSIAVRMTDGAGAFATQSFTWTVTNPPPTAVNDSATTPEDTLVNIAVLTNDSDPDGDPLTITAASSPNGTVVIRANGTLDFTPAANFNGPATISYTISDGQGGTSTGTVNVNVTAVNDPPTSVGTIANQTSVDAQSGISVATAANFADPDAGDTRTYSATGLPAGLSINASTGVISGTIDRSASQGGTGGVHSIAVKMTDGAGASATQSFTWTVTNPPPTAVNDSATTLEDTLVNIAVLTNDSDPDGDPLTITAASSPNGTVVIRANGTLDFTPAANFNGPATISYTISDGQGGTSTGTVNVNVTAVNDPPTSVGAIANQTSVDAQSGISVATAANFADPDVGDTRTYSATGLPAGLTINASTGVISGTIDRSASQGGVGGVYNIAVRMTDNAGAFATQSFTWTVTNPPPTAVNDSATTPEDTLVNIAVLTNDSDPDGDPLTITAASSPNGTVVIRANGTLDFTPAANFNGPTTISYTISDGQGGITSATVNVTVTAVNDPPTSVGTIANQTSVDAQSGISVATAANFADVDVGDTRTYSATGLPAGLTINASTGVISGTVDRSASQGGAAGVYSIAVKMTDSAGASATQSFTWTVTNPPPTAVNDSATTPEDTLVNIAVLTNDSDPDGDPLTITAASSPNGTVVIRANGTLDFTPAANFNGPATISYTISDGQGGTSTGTVNVNVTAVNDPPTSVGAIANQTSVDAQSGISVATAANFADPDVGDTRTYSATGLPAGLTINASTGVISGTIDRSASQGGVGGVYSIAVRMTDGAGAFATQSFTWTVTNPPPTAVNDSATTPEDTLVNIAVLTNDSDPDGDPLTITAASSPNGTVVIRANGTLDFTPAANFNGPATISYTISDGQGGTSTGTVNVNVTAVNDPPTSVGTIANQTSVDAQSGISVATAANFADPDAGDTRTYSATGLPAGLSINASTGVISGTIDRSASQGGTGGVHSIAVKMTDGAGASATQSFTWTVTNPPPTAVNDSATTPEDTLVNIAVLTNDSDPDGDPLTVTAASSPNGTVVIRANGTLDFTPAANFNGPATISYTISDGQGGITSATVNVTVTAAAVAVNHPPIDNGENITAVSNTPATIPVLANASDPDGDTLQVVSATSLSGTVVINPNGTITFTSNPNFTGPAIITYVISDGHGGFVTSTVTVNVISDEIGMDMIAIRQIGEVIITNKTDTGNLGNSNIGFIRVPNIIMDATNALSTLNGIGAISVNGPILDVVDTMQNMQDVGILNKVGLIILDTVSDMGANAGYRFGTDRLFHPRFGDVTIQDVKGSSVHNIGEVNSDIMVETVVRGPMLYLEIKDVTSDDGSRIVEHQLRLADGGPVPNWVHFDKRGLAIIDRPVHIEIIRFVIRSIREDGTVVRTPIILQAATGLVSLDDGGKQEAAIQQAATLSQSLAAARESTENEARRIVSAFQD